VKNVAPKIAILSGSDLKSVPEFNCAVVKKSRVYTRGFMRTATHTGRDLGQVVKDQTWHAGTYSNYIPDSPDNGILVSNSMIHAV
jgi:hypothetical protein